MISDIVRTLHHNIPFREETRTFYDYLSDPKAETEKMRDAWFAMVAPAAYSMSFIAVDPSDISKPYGKDFEDLDTVRNGSDPDKGIVAGFTIIWEASIQGGG